MSYAKKNLKDVQDYAGKFGASATQEMHLAREALGLEQTGVNYMRVKPGQREPGAHKHKQAEEVYVVLSGKGRVKLDGEIVELTPLDALRVGPGTTRCLEAGPDGLELLVFGPHVENDGELVSDFWPK